MGNILKCKFYIFKGLKVKNILPMVLTAAASFLVFKTQAANEDSWYLGAQYNLHEIDDNSDQGLSTLGAIAGYQYNEYFGLEARYNIGTSGYYHTVYVRGSKGEYKEDIDTQASLFLKVSYPIYTALNIYALAGKTKSKHDLTIIESRNDIRPTPYIMSYSESGFSYGLGLSYEVITDFKVFIDYKILPDLKMDPINIYNMNSLSFGGSYAF